MKLKKQYDAKAALQYAAGVCARGEQCEYDIREKLSGRGLSVSETDEIIDYLYENRYIDEMRFARAFCRDKARFNRWGRVKIRMHLAARRIGRDAITQGLASIDESEYSAGLLQLANQASAGVDLTNYVQRMKVVRRLVARGFEPDLIANALSKLQQCNGM